MLELEFEKLIRLIDVNVKNLGSELVKATVTVHFQRTKLVKVLFIDEGTTAWMHSACLAKMDEMLSFHPWQAIPVALFKVSFNL